MQLTDKGIIALYGLWNEDHWAASFMNPGPDIVKQFREWLKGLNEALDQSDVAKLEDYEWELLHEMARQEQTDAK